MLSAVILVAVFSYFATIIVICKCKRTANLKFKTFPHLKMTKSGIVFCSKDEHRFKFSNVKIFQIKDVIYLKYEKKIVIISNVKDVRIYNDFVYFKANGKVKILFDCKSVYKYFSLNITSKQFDLSELKQQAMIDVINNNFQINFCKILKKYIKIIENVLNIKLFQEKIVIGPNKLKLSFVITYKLNNKIKHVYINQTV